MQVRLGPMRVGPYGILQPVADAALLVDEREGFTSVVRAEQAALFGFDQRIHAIGVRGSHSDADLPPAPLRQTFGQLLPGVSPVARDPQRASRPAARHRPGRPARLPEAGEHDVGIRGVDRDVGGAGVRVNRHDLRPGLAAVLRAIDAALGIRAERLAEHRREGDIRIPRIDGHRPDLAFLSEHVRPRRAAVSGLEDADSWLDVASDIRFARSDIHDRWIGRRDHERSDRSHCLIVEHRLEPYAAVGRLEDPPGGGGEPVNAGRPRNALNPGGPPAHGGADPSILDPLEPNGSAEQIVVTRKGERARAQDGREGRHPSNPDRRHEWGSLERSHRIARTEG